MHINYNKRLPVEGAINLRDLGGYPTKDGRITKENTFFRSDSTSRLTAADITLLKERGLSLIIDLRSEPEVQREPSVFTNMPEFSYNRIPMLDNINSASDPNVFPASMYDLYVSLLNNSKADFAEIFRLFATRTGACLFNCAVGKDRTGTAAMLLLDLCGVDATTIAADYSCSEKNLLPLFHNYMAVAKKQGIEVPLELFRSTPQTMEKTLNHLHETYGSAREYLISSGTSPENLDKVVASFLTTRDSL